MLHAFTDDLRRDPYPFYEQMRAAAPALRDPRTGVWMIFEYDAARHALTDHDAFSSDVSGAGRGNLGWFIFFDPPRHTALRALVSRAFTPRVVAELEPRVRELSRTLLARVMERGAMDLVADYAAPLPLMVIAELLGAPLDDWPLFRRWSDGIVTLVLTLTGGEAAARAAQAFTAVHAEMQPYLAALLAERRRVPRGDLLTRLVQAEVDGARLTDAEILAFFQLLLLAGHETTTNLITNAVLCLLEHPRERARLAADPSLLPSAIEEVLRYRSPVQAMFRVTRRPVEMHGQQIPAGQLVMVMIGSANRDASRFPDADRFDVGRAPNPHVAFGHGIHFCIGAPLARLEARVALGDLSGGLRGLSLASHEPWEPRAAFHVHGPTRLPIRFEASAPSVVA